MAPGAGGKPASPLTLPEPCVVVLVGPGASGKTTWAAENVRPDTVVSSDRLRAVVGAGEDDLSASADAFSLLEDIVTARVGRRLTTVIDTLGLDAERRTRWRDLARSHAMPCVVVVFDTPAEECRARNRGRAHPIPAAALTSQLRTWAQTRDRLADEGYDQVMTPERVRLVPAALVGAAAAVQRQAERPTGLRFGLHLGEFKPTDGSTTASWLREVAGAAESAGFDGLYVMDHFRQIPQVGRAWDDMLESWTTLAYLAACTTNLRLGTLVTGVTYRNVGHLAKIVATLDVLSGGRAVCGLGLGWFEQEHRAYGWRFPPTAERYALLEDALELLPLMWGPGSPPYSGRVLQVPEALCYPRPLQDHVPVILGGGGEERTLRLAAQYADATNVFGDAATVRHKAEVLARHCVDVGRDPEQVAVTHLSTTLIGTDDADLGRRIEALRPRGRGAATYTADVNAGTVADQVGRFRELAEAGASEVMIRLPDQSDPESVERAGRVVAAFR